MSETTSKPKPTLLECEHTVWHKIKPKAGDIVFCEKCATYRKVPQFDENRGTYYPEGNWTCYRVDGRKVRGVCYACGFANIGEFKNVRTILETHHRRGCEIPTFNVIDLPPNSPAPF